MVPEEHFPEPPAATCVRPPAGTRRQSPWSGEMAPTSCPRVTQERDGLEPVNQKTRREVDVYLNHLEQFQIIC